MTKLYSMKKVKLLILFLVLLSIHFSSCNNEDELIRLDQFTLSVPELELSVGEVQSVIASATPKNTTENLTWVSSNEAVAAVQYNKNGFVAGVKGIATGNASLTATSADGEIVKTILVTVIKKVEKIELEEILTADLSTTSYRVIFTPADATIQTLTWSSSNPSAATVVDGLVTAVSPGVTIISATSGQGGKTASVEITVSGNPSIIGFQYCEVSGTKGYNADVVVTTGADADINYAGVQPEQNYEFYETEKLMVQPGSSFDLTVTNSNGWSRSIVWIDWNNDKDFQDEGELIGPLSDPAIYSGDDPISYTIIINVPIDATLGKSRMRILTGDAWSYADNADGDAGTAEYPKVPCGELANSCIKDFDVEIQ